MPYLRFHEYWTPLAWFGVRLFREEHGGLYVKVRNGHRRRLGRGAHEDEA